MNGSRMGDGRWGRWVVVILLLAAGLGPREARGQTGSPAPGFRHELTLDLTLLGASAAWAGSVGERSYLGVALGGGAPIGFTLMSGTLSSGRDGGPVSFVGELLHAGLFVRHRTNEVVEVEAGPRVAWMYHPGTEFETVFVGVYGAMFVRAGPLLLGPRVQIGHFEEEAGRSEGNLVIMPLSLRFRLEMGGGG